jgi:4-diphosphocytidyl-2-C-methyl-D-erythritol kinase
MKARLLKNRSSSPERLSILSPAKLNLFLDVLRRRPDGYHDIRTLFERITLADTLHLSKIPEDDIVITSNSREIPCDHENLVYKAADFIKKRYRIQQGVKIEIDKTIPVGAGLGGGSSNAASVFLGLEALFGLKLSRKARLEHAHRVGADVAFFMIDARFACGGGRGERLVKVSVPETVKLWHVLCVPHIKVITKRVYDLLDHRQNCSKTTKMREKSLKLTKKSYNVNMLLTLLKCGKVSLLNQNIYNRLSSTVMESYGLVSELKSDLLKFGLKNVHMSGSGPTLFTIFKNEAQAQRAFQDVRHRFSDRCRIFLATSL